MTAWYLKVDSAPERAVLVGDRGRLLQAAELLDDSRILNEDRGLTTVVGWWDGTEVMVSAFGMGAPIAVIVLHELATLGTMRFVRAGTMMSRRPRLGSLIVADRALIHEGTSATYGHSSPEIILDPSMADRLVKACGDWPVDRGTVASCDGFYTQMTDLLGPVNTELIAQWDRADVIGLDMETSALASAAAALKVTFGSLCLATVDVNGPVILDPLSRAAAEKELLTVALNAVTLTEGTTNP